MSLRLADGGHLLGHEVETPGEFQFVLYDFVINLLGGLSAERRSSSHHLIYLNSGRWVFSGDTDQDAECPPVDSLVVSLVGQRLGRQVFGCAAEGVGPEYSGYSLSFE